MATQKDNLFVSLLKKSVGLPTGASGCCGAPAPCACASDANAEAAPASADATHAAAPEHHADTAPSSGLSTCGCRLPAETE